MIVIALLYLLLLFVSDNRNGFKSKEMLVCNEQDTDFAPNNNNDPEEALVECLKREKCMALWPVIESVGRVYYSCQRSSGISGYPSRYHSQLFVKGEFCWYFMSLIPVWVSEN